MANENVCNLNLSKLSKADADEVRKKAEAIVKRAEFLSDTSQSIDEINRSLKDYENLLEAAKKIEKRNSYINRIKRQEMYDTFMTGNDVDKNILAYVGGVIEEFQGSRANLASQASATSAKFISNFRNMLVQEDLFGLFASGVHDKEIHQIRWKQDKGLPLDGHNPEAVKIASIIDKHNKNMVAEANRNGAFVGELDGYTVSRQHSPEKINGGRKQWVEFMKANIDFDRSYSDINPAELDKVLDAQAIEFASGVHIDKFMKEEGIGLKGYASIAKKISKSRTIHFKTPEAEYEYSKLFGTGSLYESVFFASQRMGTRVGIMSKMGPNPELNLKMAIGKIQKDLETSGRKDVVDIKKKIAKVEKEVISEILPNITGAANVTGHHIAAQISGLALSLNRWSKLGSSALVGGIGDPLAAGVNMATLDGFGSGLSTYVKMLGNLPKAAAMAIKGSSGSGAFAKEFSGLLNDLGIANDFLLTKMNPHTSEFIGLTGKAEDLTRRMDNFFFRVNLQSHLDVLNRASSALMVSQSMGRNVSVDFNSLPSGHRRLFDTHGITESDWNLARLATKDYKGSNIIAIENVRDLPDETFDEIIKAQGKKPSKFQRDYLKDQVINKFRTMFQDQNGYMVLAPDAALQAQFFGDSDRGSAWGIARRQVMQFKQYPVQYMKKVLGRQIYSKDHMGIKARNMAGIALASSAVGYITMSLQDLMAGREPKEFNGTTALQAFAKGGGLGVFNDYLISVTGNRHGDDIWQTMLGPTATNVTRLSTAVGHAVTGDFDKAMDKTVGTVASMVPLQNLFYTKPITDYLILNQMKEMASQGSLRRSEQRLERDFGQEYLFMKPSETMLFD